MSVGCKNVLGVVAVTFESYYVLTVCLMYNSRYSWNRRKNSLRKWKKVMYHYIGSVLKEKGDCFYVLTAFKPLLSSSSAKHRDVFLLALHFRFEFVKFLLPKILHRMLCTCLRKIKYKIHALAQTETLG